MLTFRNRSGSASMMRQPLAFVVYEGRERSLPAGLDVLGLARGLATSPYWAEMPEAMLVVRQHPEPMLGLVGYFDEAAVARVRALCDQLAFACEHLQYVSYAQAQADCEQLGERLRARFGCAALQQFRFTAIPRGGLIVLGLLAYVLGLKQEQFLPAGPSGQPLVVVDDCALSGRRFGEFLAKCPARQVIFAPLYAPRALRKELQVREPRVLACLSARDLEDHAPESLRESYPAWKARWQGRADGGEYWIGQPSPLCFAWSEPDLGFWNPAARRVERGWSLFPPERCLKNRFREGAGDARLQICAEGRGPLKPAPRTLYAELQEQVIVFNVNTGQSYHLNGVAADMWRALVEKGQPEAALPALRDRYEVSEKILRADLERFASKLLAQGLLEDGTTLRKTDAQLNVS